MGRIQWLLEWTQTLPLSFSRAAVRGTLLSVFRPLVHMKKSAKNREQCAKNISQKRGGTHAILFLLFNVCFTDFPVDSKNTTKKLQKGTFWGSPIRFYRWLSIKMRSPCHVVFFGGNRLKPCNIGGCRLKWTNWWLFIAIDKCRHVNHRSAESTF